MFYRVCFPVAWPFRLDFFLGFQLPEFHLVDFLPKGALGFRGLGCSGLR